MNNFKKILDESCHRIDKQYDITKYISEKIYNELFYNKKNFSLKIDLEQFCINFSEVNINVKTNGNLIDSYGSISDFDPLTIDINISKYFDLIPKEKLLLQIQNVVSHEMVHGNIFKNTYETYKNNDRDVIIKKLNYKNNRYEDYFNLMSISDSGSLFYKYAYSQYSTFFHEKQALVAQSDCQIRKIITINKLNNITNLEAKNILNNIDVYKIFADNIEFCSYLLKINKIEQEKIVQEINNMLNLNNENRITYSEFIFTNKKAIKESKDAIKSIEEILLKNFFEIKKL